MTGTLRGTARKNELSDRQGEGSGGVGRSVPEYSGPPLSRGPVIDVTETADRRAEDSERSLISPGERKEPTIRWGLRSIHVVVLAGLIIGGLGPILWLSKASITTTQDTLRAPFDLWPSGIDWQNLASAWTRAEISKYLLNTVWLALGAWLVQIIVATTGAYVLSVLRPRYARLLTGMVMATLFVPAVVLLVPLFLTILDVPLLDVSLLNSYWGVWLPAGASAFNVILMKRFFDNLPVEILEAARVDGAGPFRMLLSVVLPMAKPILAVVSVFSILATWKDFLWPLLVLPDPAIQPLSVRLPLIRDTVELDVFLASLLISTTVPVLLFLVFQRLFLRGAGLSGAIKG